MTEPGLRDSAVSNMFLGDDAQPRKSPGGNNDQQDQDQKPDHLGHRKRLRERFLWSGPDGLPDYELIELMLFVALPRRDTKPIAKNLLRRFSSFAEMVSTAPDKLKRVKGLGDAGGSKHLVVTGRAICRC